jgi:cellulose biosynthesis protein BcsQ
MSRTPANPGPVVVFVNLKGGTGKTTLSVHAAAFMEARLVDLDPQGDASDWAARSRLVDFVQAHGWEDALRHVQEGRARGPVVVDCPPGEGPALRAALSVASVAVIPAKGSMQDLRAVGRMMELVDEARAHGNPGLRAALVLNEARPSTSMAGVAEEALAKVKGAVFLGHVGLRAAFVEAFAAGRVVASGPALDDLTALVGRLSRLMKKGSV